MIKFITENQEEAKVLTFGQVEIDQFFVDSGGWLCQKVGVSSFNTIADDGGNPAADYYKNIATDKVIQKIFPIITKIKF